MDSKEGLFLLLQGIYIKRFNLELTSTCYTIFKRLCHTLVLS